jgi:hypothetical protein
MRRSVVCLFLSTAAFARPYQDPAGFRVDLPDGWRTTFSKTGHIVIASPNPQEYVYIRPIPNRTGDCSSTLRQTLTAPGAAAVSELRIAPAGARVAVARFLFQNRQVRGSILCAEVSRRGGMLYGIAAPAAEYAREAPRLLAVLRSFAFDAPRGGGVPGGGGPGGGGGPLPAMRSWREPQEMAYTLSVPAGWGAAGGVRRWDVTHYTTGVTASSPDGAAQIRVGDQRLRECQVPGPGMASVSGGQMPQGFCGDQSGPQLGQFYVTQWLAREVGLSGLRVTSVTDRPDLAQRAQASILPGLRVRYSIGEVRFQGTRNGAPAQGAVLAQTILAFAAPGQNFLTGTLAFQVQGFVGPPQQFDMLARLTGAMISSMRVNPAWWSQNQRIGREVTERTLAAMRSQAEHQQQAFWERMASMDRQREGMRDILGGTVRLSDGQGNQYEARAGSNYYFFDQEAGRTAPRPDDAVRRTDVWPGNTVDLTPLEVMR